MRPYLLSIATYVPGCENYIYTLPMLEDSVKWINVELEKYPGNLLRFQHFPKDLDEERMVIFTDTSDVIFQCRVPVLENKIYVCPEDARFDKASWWNSFFEKHKFIGLDGEQIYNMGTWAMPVKKAREMIKFLEDNAYIFDYDHFSDQPLFNLWLKTQEFEIHPSLMTCLYNNYDKGNVKKTKTGFLNRDGYLYSIVHANGNRKELLKLKNI